MSPTVSIIVPVYNAEKTLRRCIESILNQQYTDFEVLLVDDGSQDTSGVICDEYAQIDSRVQVIHKENSGVSNTRNLALDLAKGTYLQFLDSDDWITPDATSSLVRAAETNQCDLVIADFYRVVGDRLSRKGDIDDEAVLSREEFAARMMENPADFYYGVLWNKLYRRDIVEKHHLRMDPNISWCEDFMFNLEYIRYAQRFYALQVPVYYYVKTKGSLVTQSSSISRTIKMKLTVFEDYHAFFKTVLDEEEYEKVRRKVYRFLVDAAGDGTVPPPVLPNSKKLGDERNRVVPDMLRGNSPLHDVYRNRKLLEHYLETAALKNDLSLSDMVLLFAIRQLEPPYTRRDLADFIDCSRSSLSIGLQRLCGKNLIQIESLRSPETDEKQLRITLTAFADTILEDLEVALTDYKNAVFSNFTADEQAQYQAFSEKVSMNIQTALQA